MLEPSGSQIGSWISAPEVQGSKWSGEAELGYLQTGGNTVTSSFQGRARIQYEQEKWRTSARADAVVTKDHDVTTGESYLLAEKGAYKLSAVHYLFELVQWERNRLLGFVDRFTEVIGFGRRLVHSETLTLDVEGGPGARQTRHVDESVTREVIAELASQLAWNITRTSVFSEVLSVDAGEENTVTRSLSALRLQIGRGFSMKTSFEVTHSTQVPEGVKKTDTVTAVTLVYSF